MVAILVGAIIGFGAQILDGEGPLCGTICAILCVVSIIGGKYFTYSMMIDDEIGGVMEGQLTEAVHQEILTEAIAYVAVDRSNRTAIFQYMVDFEYTNATRAEDVTEEELNVFWEYDSPRLVEMGTEQPTFAEWKANIDDLNNSEVKNTSFMLTDMTDSLDLYDFLFILFGVLTAFRIGDGREEAA
jgi:hypothetical protein